MLPALGILLAIVLVVLLLGTVAARKRRDAWSHFARRHQLRRAPDAAAGERLEGETGGRSIWMRRFTEASDTELPGVAVLELGAPLARAAPRGLVVRDMKGPVGTLEQKVREDGVASGDAAFDAATHVAADDADAARAWLTSRRRAAIRAFFDAARSEDARVREDAVVLRRREIVPSLRRLEADRALLLDAARSLDEEAS